MITKFDIPIRVYYEDTDAQGVVYYANYLKYFERARTEWLRAFSVPVAQLASDKNLIFMVRRLELDYLRPARLDDLLQVSLSLIEKNRVSFSLNQQVIRADELICEARVKMICLDATKFKPVRIPDTINCLFN